MNGRRTGNITCKDGSTFEVKSKRPAENNKSMYGFSAKQIEGLKLLSTATTNSSIDDQTAAPASVKRQRVFDRLGQANNAYKQDNNIQQFLDAICNTNANDQ